MTHAKSLIHILLLQFLVLLVLVGPVVVPADPLPKSSARIIGKAEPAQKKPVNGKVKLAVLELDRSGVESELAFSLSVALRDELFALGEYEVLGPEDLRALAKRLSLQQQAGDECADEQCLVSYGRSLGTRYMVAGVLSKVGNTYSVSLRLLDTEGDAAGVKNRVSARCKCSEDELFGTVAAAAAKLMGKKPAAADAVVSTPSPAVAVPVAAPVTGGNSTDPATGMAFAPVPGGCFQMGDTFGEGLDDERPVHEVCVDGFLIGKHEVTQGQWQKIMGNNPAKFQKGDDYPVESVSWNDVQEFIAKLNRPSGRNYRLPTEAEWEYAARSGGRREKYSGGDNLDPVAWYGGNSGDAPHPVGTKAANGLGIHDMSGNVWEWVRDWYGSYADSHRNNPTGPASGSDSGRVVRGGGWGSELLGTVRTTMRLSDEPGNRNDSMGFRLVLPVQ